ncbi:hypothetical protein [Acanthopleuribacter pedis]|uniref:Uncharacterized protein n=1 Tax=Acanthopleuribacter pedis TaxID=442870 RepID=A0A8J7Q6H2_9BACT|nr:hypothetical protein [Acanthopleuribacter pedis]MBO1321412.1 hypothetical protein [Acanthopleuribacter pedis]
MNVFFSAEVVNDDTCYRALDEMVFHFERGRHVWDVANFEDLDQSGWFQEAGRSNPRPLFEKFLRDSLLPKERLAHSIHITVQTTTTSDHQLSPEDARRSLARQVIVAVENPHTDGCFLRAMLAAYARQDLLADENETWKLERMGGYGEVAKVIAEVRAMSPGPVRMMVLADSDRDYPGHESATITKVTRSCTEAGIPFHILEKRSIENYIPHRIWFNKGPRKNRHWIRLFWNLNQEQRDHFPIKRGLSLHMKKGSTAFKEDAKEVETLYRVVPKTHREVLRNGAGEVAHQFTEEVITEDDINLLCPNHPNEIKELIQKLESLI